jgi:hypothetical protein
LEGKPRLHSQAGPALQAGDEGGVRLPNPDAADGEYESIPEFRYSYYPFDDLEELE